MNEEQRKQLKEHLEGLKKDDPFAEPEKKVKTKPEAKPIKFKSKGVNFRALKEQMEKKK